MANRGTWKKIIQLQRFLKTKDSQVFLANGPTTVMNLKFAKKTYKYFVFKKWCDWIIFSQGPRFEWPH